MQLQLQVFCWYFFTNSVDLSVCSIQPYFFPTNSELSVLQTSSHLRREILHLLKN